MMFTNKTEVSLNKVAKQVPPSLIFNNENNHYNTWHIHFTDMSDAISFLISGHSISNFNDI